MGWKKFLKPNKRTIVVFLLFLVLIGIYSWLAMPCPLFNIQPRPGYYNFGSCGTLPPQGSFVLWWPLGIVIQFLFNSGSTGSMIEVLWKTLVLLTGFTVNLSYFYLLVVLFYKINR